jgi:hypothetical protein
VDGHALPPRSSKKSPTEPWLFRVRRRHRFRNIRERHPDLVRGLYDGLRAGRIDGRLRIVFTGRALTAANEQRYHRDAENRTHKSNGWSGRFAVATAVCGLTWASACIRRYNPYNDRNQRDDNRDWHKKPEHKNLLPEPSARGERIQTRILTREYEATASRRLLTGRALCSLRNQTAAGVAKWQTHGT